MNITCDNCSDILGQYFEDIPYKWREQIIMSLCEMIKSSQNNGDIDITECEAITTLSAFKRVGNIISIDYTNENGFTTTSSVNIQDIFDASLNEVDPKCIMTSEEWVELNHADKINALIAYKCDCCPTTTTTSSTTTTTTIPVNTFSIYNNTSIESPFVITFNDFTASIEYLLDSTTESGTNSFYDYNGTTNTSTIVINHVPDVNIDYTVLVDGSTFSSGNGTGLIIINNITPQTNVELVLNTGLVTTTTTTSTTTTSTTTSTTLVPTTTTTTKAPFTTTTTTTTLQVCPQILGTDIEAIPDSGITTTTTTSTTIAPITTTTTLAPTTTTTTTSTTTTTTLAPTTTTTTTEGSTTTTTTLCPDCAPGYSATADGLCVAEYTQSATSPTSALTLTHFTNVAYGTCGSYIYDVGYNYNGTGTSTKIPISNTFWLNGTLGNCANAGTNGPLNRSGVWVNPPSSNQEVGFSVCITIPTTKTYYIGLGADNYSIISLDGTRIMEQNATAIGSQYSAVGAPFKVWHIYPVELTAGDHILECIGHNNESVATIGAEIYDNTPAEIAAATSYAGLNLIFSSKDQFGQPAQIGTGGVGYTCPTGYALVLCDGPAYCKKIDYIDCGASPTTTTTTTIP